MQDAKPRSFLESAAFSQPFVQAVAALAVLLAFTAAGFSLHTPVQLALCFYLAFIVVFSFNANLYVSLGADVLAVVLLDMFFTPPIGTITPQDPLDWLTLAIFCGTTVAVTRTVTSLKQRSADLLEANTKLRASMAMLQQTQEFARSNRIMLMGEMTASISHEINQPLTGIVLNAGTALRYLNAGTPDLNSVRHYIELVLRDGKRATETIDRVRGLARRSPPDKVWIDLNEAILEVVALAQTQLDRQSVGLHLSLSENLPLIKGERIQLQQVLLNLIVNASEAMQEIDAGNRELTIASGSDGDRAFVEVRDAGPGLQPEHAGRLFESFYTTKPEGMGMGLSISRLIVEGHGGELSVRTNEPRGAIFRFTLPLGDGTQA